MVRWRVGRGSTRAGRWDALLPPRVSAEGGKRGKRERTAQLRCSPEVDEVLVVVQSPDSLTPRRLQLVHLLQLPHDVQVGSEHPRHERLFVLGAEDADQAQDEEVGEEGELVPCAVV